jgi:hypothetical protein
MEVHEVKLQLLQFDIFEKTNLIVSDFIFYEIILKCQLFE